MRQPKKSFPRIKVSEYRKGLLVLGMVMTGMMLVELFVFNQGMLISRIHDLPERRYTIRDGSIYQFNLRHGKLIAQGYDPNITFDNIDLPVATVLIECTNTISGSVGQVFYRSDGQEFSESRSVQYDASLSYIKLFLSQFRGIPKTIRVSSLRLDLTNSSGDKITCSDFVINPHIPLKLSGNRLVLYLGVFLCSVFVLFKKTTFFGRLLSSKFFSPISFFLVVFFILGAKLLPVAISKEVIFITLLCIFLFSFALTYLFVYLYLSSRPLHKRKSIWEVYKYEIIIVVVIVIATLPLLTETYYYFDDWWYVGDNAVLNKQAIVSLARPVQTLINVALNKIEINNSYLFKWAFLPALVLYTLVLYRWIYSKTNDQFISFILSSVLGVFSPAMDLIGYTSAAASSYSILFSSLSVISFDIACQNYHKREKISLLVNCIFVVVFLFVALLTYQVGAQIAFFLISIGIYFNRQNKSLYKENISFLFLFGLSHVFYLLFIRLLNRMYLVETNAIRSQLISSFSQIIEKLHFYMLVVRQSVMQIINMFTGGQFVLEKYHGYIISFSNEIVGTLFYYFVIAMIFAAFVFYWARTKNILGLLSLILLIPMSFFVFLVLTENGYLTYYAFAHISLFTFYFLMGFFGLIQLILKKLKMAEEVNQNLIIGPLLILCAFTSNYYVQDFYINYNQSVFNFVKYSLQTSIESGKIERIHVYGLLSPLNADVYSRFITETALKDLNENVNDYEITFSRNKYFLARINEEDYLKILEHTPESEVQKLEKFYVFDPVYRQYNLSSLPSKEDKIKLQRIFMLADLIPQENSSTTLIVDLTWTDTAYFQNKDLQTR